MQARGFTMIELLTALAVLAILAAIAAPSFSSFTARQQARSVSSDLHSDLLFARSEALKRNENVSIRRREASGWNTGWVVLVDSSAAELRTRGAVSAKVSIDSPSPAVTFGGSGRVVSPAGAVQIGLQGHAGSQTFDRCLVLTPNGMPRALPEACI